MNAPITSYADIPNKRRLLFFLFLAWSFIGLAYVSSAYVDAYRFNPNFRFSWPFVALVLIVYNSWGVLSVVLYRRLLQPVQHQQWLRCGLIFVLGLLLWQPLISSFDVLMSRVILGSRELGFWQQLLRYRVADLFQQSMLYTVGFFACAVVIYARYAQGIQRQAANLEQQRIQAQRDLADMKMQVLQSQLSPHFLFNSLNSISAMARSGESAGVVEATAQLAELLRFALTASQQPLISVQDEVDFTKQYVNLQQLRFGQRYICSIDINEIDAIQTLECPPFVLQTLIENAFTHNHGQVNDPVYIQTQISFKEQRLHITVSNTIKPGSDVHESNGLSLALRNLHHRLQLIYGDDYLLSDEISNGEFIVHIELPAFNLAMRNGSESSYGTSI